MNNINRRSVLEISHDEAREFFLKDSSYCNFNLPSYFSFEELLKNLSNELTNKNFNDIKAIFQILKMLITLFMQTKMEISLGGHCN